MPPKAVVLFAYLVGAATGCVLTIGALVLWCC
jgi:hypothetical protein